MVAETGREVSLINGYRCALDGPIEQLKAKLTDESTYWAGGGRLVSIAKAQEILDDLQANSSSKRSHDDDLKSVESFKIKVLEHRNKLEANTQEWQSYEYAVQIAENLISDYSYDDEYLLAWNLIKNSSTLRDHWFPDWQGGAWSDGVCGGLTYGYVSAVLTGDLETFSKRLQLLSRDPEEGWSFFGKQYFDLPEAVDDAQEFYTTWIESQKRSGQDTSFFGTFRKECPDAFQLLELRAWLNIIVLRRDPSETSLRSYHHSQHDFSGASAILASEALGAGKDIQGQNFHVSQIWTVTTPSAGVENLVSNLSDGVYNIILGNHTMAISKANGVLTIFDQNLPQYFQSIRCSQFHLVIDDFFKRLAPNPETQTVTLGIQYVGSDEKTAEQRNQETKSKVHEVRKKHKVSPLTPDKGGYTELYLAGSSGNMEALQMVLDECPNVKPEEKVKAIINAADNGSVEALEWILNIEDPNYSYEGMALQAVLTVVKNASLTQAKRWLVDYPQKAACALYCCADYGRKDMAEFLLQGHVSPQGAPLALVKAVQKDNPEIIKLLIDRGADVDVKYEGESFMTQAVKSGNLSSVKALSSVTELVNAPNREGKTPLYIAVERGDIETVRILQEAGADQCEEVKGMFPVFLAAMKGNMNVVETLLKGIDWKNVPAEMKNILIFAIKKNDEKLIQILVDANMDMNEYWGPYLPIHIAVREGSIEAASKLLDITKNANVYENDDDGQSPLSCAVTSGNKEMVKVLLGKGADINQTCSRSESSTALHVAVMDDNLDLVKFLVEKGADVHME